MGRTRREEYSELCVMSPRLAHSADMNSESRELLDRELSATLADPNLGRSHLATS